MPLSAKTKNLLDLFSELAKQDRSLHRFTTDVVEAGLSYVFKNEDWPTVVILASEMAARDGASA
jgi:hypothetical protein